MNIELFTTTNLVIISLIVFAVLVLIIGLFLVFKKKQPKKKEVSLDELSALMTALGSFDNIIKVNQEQQRIQILVTDTKKIDALYFTLNKIPAFVSGNKVTILIKDHSKEIYEFLSGKGA